MSSLHTDQSGRGAASHPPAPFTLEVKVRLQALVIPEAEGGYSIIVPALPGCASRSETLEETQANLVEAAKLWLEVAHDRGKDEATRVARGQ